MKTAIRNIILSTSFMVAASAQAAAPHTAEIDSQMLQPMQAHTIALDGYTAVVYYTVLANGDYQIVTSTGPNPGVEGEMTQNSVTVAAGEWLIYSLQTAPGSAPVDIRFAAMDQALIVASR